MAEPRYKKALKMCYPTLVEDLNSADIMDQFRATGLFTTTTIQTFQGKELGPERNRKILDTVHASGPENFQKFKECLRNSKQEHLAESLEEAERAAQEEDVPERRARDEVDASSGEERNCPVCRIERINCTLVPCGHMTCMNCASQLTICPMCRDPIREKVRNYQ